MPRKAQPKPAPTSPLDKTLASMADEQGRTTAPTPEWRAKHELQVIEASREGKWTDKQAATVRVTKRSDTWHRNGWIDADQKRALDAWEALNDAARLEGVKARDYSEPRGVGDAGCRPEHIGMCRRRLGQVNLALCGDPGIRISRSVWVWLTTSHQIDYKQFDTGPRDGKMRAQSMVRRVADKLHSLKL